MTKPSQKASARLTSPNQEAAAAVKGAGGKK